MSKHTPGPWTVIPFERKDGSGFAVCHDNEKPIAWLYQASPNAFKEMRIVPLNQTANSNLIAAAPELLIALEGAIVALKLGEHVDQRAAIEYGLEVLAKATGGAK